jgi:HAE1 family hydrophobic/amphiphilic exporter-1
LIPLAAGFNQGSIIAAELGTVVIGGLFSSTFLTLLVVPVVYSMVDGGKQTISRWFRRSPVEEEPTTPLLPAVAMAVPSGSPSRVAPPIGHAIPDMPIVVESAAGPELPAGGTMALPAGERRPGVIGRFLRWLLRR